MRTMALVLCSGITRPCDFAEKDGKTGKEKEKEGEKAKENEEPHGKRRKMNKKKVKLDARSIGSFFCGIRKQSRRHSIDESMECFFRSRQDSSSVRIIKSDGELDGVKPRCHKPLALSVFLVSMLFEIYWEMFNYRKDGFIGDSCSGTVLGLQVEQSILHLGYDSYKSSFH